MTSQQELLIELPTKLAEDSCGFALDWGGSAIKIAYLHKDDAEKLSKEETKPSKTKIRLALYSESEFEKALSVLKNNCFINRKKDACPRVFVTGMGCSKAGKVIEEELNVRFQNLLETDFTVKGLFYSVNTLTYNDLIHIPTPDMRSNFESTCKASEIVGLATQQPPHDKVWNRDVRNHPDGPMVESVPDVYPCMVFVLSSALWSTKVHSDGKYEIMGTWLPAGHPFLGLGSFICGGVKTYDQLIDLAEKGDSSKLDGYWSETVTMESPDTEDEYGNLVTPTFVDIPIYPLKKASVLPPDNFKLEDRMRGFLRAYCMSIAGSIMHTMLVTDVKHAFVLGCFANRELVRELIETEFHRQRVVMGYCLKGKGFDKEIHFPKTAGYMGAIGAFVHNSDPTLPGQK